jgi:multiple sugar transport system ATP-binding protein
VASVTFERTTKRFGDVVAVSDLSLEIEDGELMVLVGPSGSGKTTALRMLAGLESISAGHVWIGGRVVDDLPPRDRDIAMVFQDYALYPQMTVTRNLEFGLRTRRLPRDEIGRRVRKAATMLGLGELLARKPRELSGGQRQRVALGRALVREPQVFLMDEPLSNLDAKLRVQTRVEIARLQSELDVTTVYVTHDQTEAMTLGDRVAVLRAGVLQQVGVPQELYRRPRNLFVAGFIGSPSINLVEARIERANGALWARFGEHRLRIEDGAARVIRGDRVVMGIRPEALEDASLAPEAPPERRLSAVLELREDVGSDVFGHFRLDAPPVVVDEMREMASSEAAPDLERARSDDNVMVARLHAGTTARPGERIEVTVDMAGLHFFDPVSHERLGE